MDSGNNIEVIESEDYLHLDCVELNKFDYIKV